MRTPRTTRIPKLRHHKATGQGYVVLNGRHCYLGRYDSPKTPKAYHRLIAEWLDNDRRLPVEPDEITITELCASYLIYATDYYRKPDGSPTSSISNVRTALRALIDLYGDIPAAEFGPRALRLQQRRWAESGLSRSTVNHYVLEIRRLFKWAAARELVPPEKYHALATVGGLKAGRSEARETEPVSPVLDAHIEAVKPFVSRQVSALIDLQVLTGARSGELLGLRPIDLRTTEEVWTATLRDHKTRYRGRERVLYFGPRAQEVLREFLTDRALEAYLFSPKDAEAERAATAPTHRRPRQSRKPNRTERTLGDRYTTDSYRRPIVRACKSAEVPAWTPHQLRHTAATRFRREFGLDAAQVMLGHSKAEITQVYAELDLDRAFEVARRMG